MRRRLALAFLLLLPGSAQAQVGHGEQVDITGAHVPSVLVADRVFYIDVDVQNRQGQAAEVQLFAVLYNMTGSQGACDPMHTNQPLSAYRKAVHLDALQTVHVDGKEAAWQQKVVSGNLDGTGEHEMCVWSQWTSCPQGPVLACATDTWSVRVPVRIGNAPPQATARSDQDRVLTGQPVTLTATARDPDGDALSTSWDLGDGTRAEGLAVQHTYRAPGVYRVTFTASDGFDTATRPLTVVVDPPNQGGARTPLPPLLGLAALALAGLAARRGTR